MVLSYLYTVLNNYIVLAWYRYPRDFTALTEVEIKVAVTIIVNDIHDFGFSVNIQPKECTMKLN